MLAKVSSTPPPFFLKRQEAPPQPSTALTKRHTDDKNVVEDKDLKERHILHFSEEVLVEFIKYLSQDLKTAARLASTCRTMRRLVYDCAERGHLGPIPFTWPEFFSNASRFGVNAHDLRSIKLTLQYNWELQALRNILVQDPCLGEHIRNLEFDCITIDASNEQLIKTVFNKITRIESLSMGHTTFDLPLTLPTHPTFKHLSISLINNHPNETLEHPTLKSLSMDRVDHTTIFRLNLPELKHLSLNQVSAKLDVDCPKLKEVTVTDKTTKCNVTINNSPLNDWIAQKKVKS